jgi:glycosyltransferase involved in cell wall biosynthesis
VIVVETDPPLLGALGALLKAWHRCALVFYLQDLFPEVGLATGKLKPGLLTALLHRATQLGLRRADRVVVLGEDMRRRVLARGIDAAKIVVIPNWIDTRLVRPAADTLRKAWELNGEFAVMYSGNLGLSQGLDHVLEAARLMRGEPVMFLFVGEGAAKGRLEARAAEWKLPNVRFLPYQPRERLSASLGTADLHLVPLQRGLTGCIVPSKLYGILAAARPYVAAVEEDSEVARVTRENATGLLVEPDDPGRLVGAVRWAMANRDELAEMGRRGRQLAEAEYDRRRAVASFEAVLRQAVSVRAGRRGEP